MRRLDLFESNDGRFTSTEKEVGLYEKGEVDVSIKLRIVTRYDGNFQNGGTYMLVLASGEIVVDTYVDGKWVNTPFNTDIIMCSEDALPSRLAYCKSI
jgi:hypothetical protein